MGFDILGEEVRGVGEEVGGVIKLNRELQIVAKINRVS